MHGSTACHGRHVQVGFRASKTVRPSVHNDREYGARDIERSLIDAESYQQTSLVRGSLLHADDACAVAHEIIYLKSNRMGQQARNMQSKRLPADTGPKLCAGSRVSSLGGCLVQEAVRCTRQRCHGFCGDAVRLVGLSKTAGQTQGCWQLCQRGVYAEMLSCKF